jgi:hypothetical protein
MALAGRNADTGRRRSIAILWNRIHSLATQMSHELLNELGRLNSARVGEAELSRLAPRVRVRAVKAALVEHHKGASRCC